MAYIRSFFPTFPFLLAAFDVGIVISENGSSSLKFPPGHPRNCPLEDGVYRFEVLPGAGWDNLRNQHMGVVFARNYSGCETSDDSKFLIPDNMVLYPVKNSKVETFAEFYDHWKNYSSVTTKTINAEASATFKKVSISGSFSSEFQSVKKHQVEDNSVTTRVQIRHDLYKAKLEPGSALQPAFKSRILEIASHLQHNNTAYANYLAQLLVRDYGTHYITSVNAGAVLAKVDHLTKKYAASFEGEKSKITAAASLSFFQFFGVDFSAKISYSHSTEKQNADEYEKNIVHSTVFTFGGPPFRANLSISQWENQLLDELVPVDRAGDPLHFSISPGNLPEISENLISVVSDVVKRAIKQYYQRNTINGCTKLDAPNFSFEANFDDGSCKKTSNSYTFGGVYQTCQCVGSPADNPCEPLLQKNPLTSDYSCSAGYEPVFIHQGSTPHSCRRECESCGFLWLSTCCQETCGNAFYETYWCVAEGQVPPNTGYLFGGLYSHMITNPVTEARSCPLKFYPLQFGSTMHVCVSDDYEMSSEEAVPFGGFFSCSHGNPLSNTGQSMLEKYVSQPGPPDWLKTCPTGYSQHLGAIEEDCEINFCVKSNVFNSRGLPIIRRPPYVTPPKIMNYSTPMLLVNQDVGQTWFRQANAPQWLLATKSSVEKYVAENNPNGSSEGGLSAGTAAGVTFGVTAFVGLLIAAILIGWRRHKTLSPRNSESTEPLNSGGEYGAIRNEGNSSV